MPRALIALAAALRSAARKVTAPAVLVRPAYQSIPLRWYAPELRPVPDALSR